MYFIEIYITFILILIGIEFNSVRYILFNTYFMARAGLSYALYCCALKCHETRPNLAIFIEFCTFITIG